MPETKSSVFHIIIVLLIGLLFVNTNQQVNAQTGFFPDTLRTCFVDSLQLMAGSGFTNYQWNTGDTTQSIWVSGNGKFIVTAIGDTTITDSTYVKIFPGFILASDTSINCGDTVVLSGNISSYTYLWLPGEETDTSIMVFPRDTTVYYVTLSDSASPSNYCIDSVKVSVETLITIDTIKQLGMGCKGEEKGRIKFEVSGGYPGYEFDWPAEAIVDTDPSLAFGLTDGEKTITITDSIGCSLTRDFTVKAFPLPELEISTDPSDTVYQQKPYITFSYTNPEYDSLGTDTFYLNWSQWNFGDNDSSTLLSPTHIYPTAGTFDVLFKFRTFYDCYGEDSIKVVVKPVKLLIPAVFTPNGDGFNDTFEIWNDEGGDGTGNGNGSGSGSYKASESDPIDLSEYYLSNTLVIFNRWGEKVYEVNNYQNDWKGENLVDGVYFYVLKCYGEHGDDVYKGSVSILSSQP